MRARQFTLLKLLPILSACATMAGCVGSSNGTDTGAASRPAPSDNDSRISDARRTYSLDLLPTAVVTVNNEAFRVWLARESAPRATGALRTVVEEGLMFVPPEEIADDQGMLFVFSDERMRGFWMLNTITPLDIAFARANGTIVRIQQMPPYTLQTFSSIEPAMFALEVRQGTFARLGIAEGDRIEIPSDVLHGTP